MIKTIKKYILIFISILITITFIFSGCIQLEFLREQRKQQIDKRNEKVLLGLFDMLASMERAEDSATKERPSPSCRIRRTFTGMISAGFSAARTSRCNSPSGSGLIRLLRMAIVPEGVEVKSHPSSME